MITANDILFVKLMTIRCKLVGSKVVDWWLLWGLLFTIRLSSHIHNLPVFIIIIACIGFEWFRCKLCFEISFNRRSCFIRAVWFLLFTKRLVILKQRIFQTAAVSWLSNSWRLLMFSEHNLIPFNRPFCDTNYFKIIYVTLVST